VGQARWGGMAESGEVTKVAKPQRSQESRIWKKLRPMHEQHGFKGRKRGIKVSPRNFCSKGMGTATLLEGCFEARFP
jgi:hypothetical protein